MQSGKAGKIFCAAVSAAIMLSAWTLISAPVLAAADADDAQAIVEKARITFNSFMRDKDYSYFQENIAKARGVVIYPQVLKAGFIFGGSAETGCFSSKTRT